MAAYNIAWKIALAAAAICGCCFLQTSGGAASSEEVDLALVIATDVSYSVDENEAHFQRQGAVSAFRNPEVVRAIQSGPRGRIVVAYIDFATLGANRVIVDWHIVHDKPTADAFADILEAAPRTLGVNTSISSGIELAEHLLDTVGYTADKRMIDISGDGPNNEGHLVDRTRDEALAKGIVINGLPIMTPADQFDIYYLPDIDRYYAGCVIGGPGSFIQVAHGYEDLERALRRKLVQEISSAPPPHPEVIKVAATAPHTTHPPYEKGCDIGERMRFGLLRRPEREADLQFLPPDGLSPSPGSGQ
jgi:hypothetical protein